MRAKQIWTYLPLPSKIKLVWQRITLSKLTTFYFLFSLFHFTVQLVLQAQAFDINATAAAVLFNIVKTGNHFIDGFIANNQGQLRVCEAVPTTFSSADCQILYPIQANDTNIYPGLGYNMSLVASTSSAFAPLSTSTSTSASSTSLPSSSSASVTASANATSSTTGNDSKPTVAKTNHVDQDAVSVSARTTVTEFVTATATGEKAKATDVSKRELEETSVVVTTQGTMNNVTLNGFGSDGHTVQLSTACMVALNWPVEKLDNTKREDITSIAFEFWVLGMSVVALLNESIPHIVAALFTHVLASVWGAYQLYSTQNFKDQFLQLSSADGPCADITFLQTYWAPRQDAEIASLALNAAALLISAFLSWKLVKAFGWQTFKRVGASRTINFVYKIVLILSIAIQLSLFFVVASMALWIDQLYNGAVGHLAKNQLLFKALYIAAFCTLLPWLTLGWIASRREKRKLMAVFIFLSFGYIGLWGVMWISPSFRWTFVTWPFFAALLSIALLLMVLTFVLAIVCRLNFGKGLPHYLHSMDPLPGDDFVSALPDGYGSDPEKVDFPSDEMAIPTFSVAFGGNGEAVPPPSQMHFASHGGRRVSPIDTSMNMTRSTISSASDAEDTPIPKPVESHLRLERQNSQSSQSSTNSRSPQSLLGRNNSTSSGTSGRSIGQTNRWVIE